MLSKDVIESADNTDNRNKERGNKSEGSSTKSLAERMPRRKKQVEKMVQHGRRNASPSRKVWQVYNDL
jgi:hypothetical protein